LAKRRRKAKNKLLSLPYGDGCNGSESGGSRGARLISGHLFVFLAYLFLACIGRRRCGGAPALFCVATAFAFHLDLADKAERTLFVKDLAIAGALMVIAAGAA
jgi:hypothetical protein